MIRFTSDACTYKSVITCIYNYRSTSKCEIKHKLITTGILSIVKMKKLIFIAFMVCKFSNINAQYSIIGKVLI